jgi:hypothetical protein
MSGVVVISLNVGVGITVGAMDVSGKKIMGERRGESKKSRSEDPRGFEGILSVNSIEDQMQWTREVGFGKLHARPCQEIRLLSVKPTVTPYMQRGNGHHLDLDD